MRNIHSDLISDLVCKLSQKACYELPVCMNEAIERARDADSSALARHILDQILKNAKIAQSGFAPICQDTGMCVVFVDIGQEVHIEGDYLEDAINIGVARGYELGYLRKSVVDDPLFERKNTQNNTPAIIITRIVKGDKIKIKVAPKGFGSENKSALKMLTPADGVDGVRDFFIDTVKKAGPNSCPPMVIGVGIGGTMERAALLAKIAAVRDVGLHNKDPRYAKFEDELLELAKQSRIGAQGFGGDSTALGVNIEFAPTHIAGLPVAININCHAARHADGEI